MKKNLPIIIGLFLLIAGLAFITSWQRKSLMENLSGEFDFAWEPLDLESIENLPSILRKDTPGNKEFVNFDRKLRLAYPSSYITVEDETILKALTHQEWVEKYNLQTLFSAQKFKEDEFSQIIIHKGTFGLSIEEIIEENRAIEESQGWSIEIIDIEIKENEGILKTKYTNSSTSFLYVKEKILQLGKETYLISIFYLPKDVSSLEQEINEIIDSFQFISQENQ
jgi:hypothetical protein